MELYEKTSYELAELLTKRYSTSFSMSSQLFDPSIRQHVYAVYGLVRIADEIVDTYRGDDALERLDELETETERATSQGYSVNPIVHAFAQTARVYRIGASLTQPFFASMRVDLDKQDFTEEEYQTYIYGSAEVVGLMCLEVFTGTQTTKEQTRGARALGAAYQKINFLRDIQADFEELGRVYFPGIASLDAFDDEAKEQIIRDIDQDLAIARPALALLPDSARRAVTASYLYYSELLELLRAAPASRLKQERVRVPNAKKLLLYAKVRLGGSL